MLPLQPTYSCHLQYTSIYFFCWLPLCTKRLDGFLHDMTARITIIIVKKSMVESFRLVLTSQKWAQTMVFREVNFSIITCPWMGFLFISAFVTLLYLIWLAFIMQEQTRHAPCCMCVRWAFWHLKFKERRFYHRQNFCWKALSPCWKWAGKGVIVNTFLFWLISFF